MLKQILLYDIKLALVYICEPDLLCLAAFQTPVLISACHIPPQERLLPSLDSRTESTPSTTAQRVACLLEGPPSPITPPTTLLHAPTPCPNTPHIPVSTTMGSQPQCRPGTLNQCQTVSGPSPSPGVWHLRVCCLTLKLKLYWNSSKIFPVVIMFRDSCSVTVTWGE